MSARQRGVTDLFKDEAAAEVLRSGAHAAQHELVQDSAQVLQDGKLVHQDVCQQRPQAQGCAAARAATERLCPALSSCEDVVERQPHLKTHARLSMPRRECFSQPGSGQDVGRRGIRVLGVDQDWNVLVDSGCVCI